MQVPKWTWASRRASEGSAADLVRDTPPPSLSGSLDTAGTPESDTPDPGLAGRAKEPRAGAGNSRIRYKSSFAVSVEC